MDSAFKQIEVVEQEIERMIKLYPKRKIYLYNSFMMFGEDASKFGDYDLRLWRHHVRELLQRVAEPLSRKEDREMGTDAEALIAFSTASLAAPLTHDGTMAFATLFENVYGKAKMHEMFDHADEMYHESYKNAGKELVSIAKRGTSKARNYPTDEYIAKKANEDFRAGNTTMLPDVFQLTMEP
jgi:hypothetical protein